jgi:hypothetical protein
MSSTPQNDERWQHELGETLQRAHEELGTASIRRVARELELSHASLVRVRQGDLGAVSRETLLRILDYYGVKPPDELAFGESTGGVAATRKIAAYCGSAQCPTAQVMFTNERWVVRPLTLRVPSGLFRDGNEGVCRECGAHLHHQCPECGQKYTTGAFCPWCGTSYVATGDLRDDELRELRGKWHEQVKFRAQVEEY